jgi:hypothetical protein
MDMWSPQTVCRKNQPQALRPAKRNGLKPGILRRKTIAKLRIQPRQREQRARILIRGI